MMTLKWDRQHGHELQLVRFSIATLKQQHRIDHRQKYVAYRLFFLNFVGANICHFLITAKIGQFVQIIRNG